MLAPPLPSSPSPDFQQPLQILPLRLRRRVRAQLGRAADQRGELLGAAGADLDAAAVLAVEPLDLDGVVVIADAMHTQVDTAQWIRGRGGHYLLTVKDNQKTLRRTLKALPWKSVPSISSVDTSHGRRVRRTVKALEGEQISLSLKDGKLTLNGSATVITANILATNGVIHVIDTVIVPPSLSA